MLLKNMFKASGKNNRGWHHVYPKIEMLPHTIFLNYAWASQTSPKWHRLDLSYDNPKMPANLLDYDTEGAWYAEQHWVRFNYRSHFPGTYATRFRFEKREDYAMFRIWGFV